MAVKSVDSKLRLMQQYKQQQNPIRYRNPRSPTPPQLLLAALGHYSCLSKTSCETTGAALHGTAQLPLAPLPDVAPPDRAGE